MSSVGVLPYVGKFWRINGSKVFGEEKFGESVGSILKILAFINELPTVRQIRQKFPPPKFSHLRYLKNLRAYKIIICAVALIDDGLFICNIRRTL